MTVTVYLRSAQTTPLTYSQMDANFQNLATAINTGGGGSSTGTGANVLQISPVIIAPNITSIVNSGITLTMPSSVSDTLVGATSSQTLQNKIINGSVNTFSNIPNTALVNSQITINGTAVQLGGSTSVSTANMTGATSGTAGTSGSAPAPSAGQQGAFLRGDATWANPTAATMTGATSGAAGTAGLAPSPAAGNQNYFLRGDATWQPLPTTPYATNSTQGVVILSSTTPLVNGTASVGASTTVALADHVHPTDSTRAPLASPTFTGTVTAPTFVGALTGNASTATNVSYSGLTGTVPTWNQNTTGTASNVTGTVAVANGGTGVTTSTGSGSVVLSASPALTGTPTVPTAAANTSTTQAASTAFVTGQAATIAPLSNGTAAVGTSLLYARQDHVHPAAANMTGATAGAAGTAGSAPAPAAGQQNSFLRGDATWASPMAATMTGASSGATGTAGIVPAPIAGQQATVLRGNATWQLPWQPYTAVLAVSGASTTGGSFNNYFPAPVYSQAGVAGWSGTSPLTVTLNTSGVLTLPTAGAYYLEFYGSTNANATVLIYIFLNTPSTGLTIYNSTGAYLAQAITSSGTPYCLSGASTVVATQSGTVSIGFGTSLSATAVSINGGLKVTRVDSGL